MSEPIELMLFDVDGTLLDKHRVTRTCMSVALKEVFGSDGPIDQYSMSGKTDMRIMRELMQLNGVSIDEINEKMPRVCQVYVQVVRERISTFDIYPCVGIPQLLEALKERKEITLGLLTGNLEGIVVSKLRKAGLLDNIFLVGAYGSDSEDRDLLPDIAISRAEKSLKRKIYPSSVVVIGDTPLDISCARAARTKAMAVATGNYSVEELEKYKPDYLVRDFSNLDAALKTLNLM